MGNYRNQIRACEGPYGYKCWAKRLVHYSYTQVLHSGTRSERSRSIGGHAGFTDLFASEVSLAHNS